VPRLGNPGFCLREKNRVVRAQRRARWIKRLDVLYRRGCTTGIRRDEMEICAGKASIQKKGYQSWLDNTTA
jgi:hypothetical protein